MPALRFPLMLASTARAVPDDLAGWSIEPKWDGIRIIAEGTPRGVRLWTRNGNDKSAQFPEIAAAVRLLVAAGGPLVLDGEIVATDGRGAPQRFQALQGRMHATRSDTVSRNSEGQRTAYVCFDILQDGARSLVNEPARTRRAVLEARVPGWPRAVVRRGASVRCGTAAARRLFARARAERWEGVILKRIDAPYVDRRSPAWRKVKLEQEQEFVIGGYTPPTPGARRDALGALLVGYYDDHGALRYAGKVGTGFDRQTLRLLGDRLRPLLTSTSPFADAPRRRDGSLWVRPALVCQVKYNEVTESGVLRQPVYLGLRDDRAARDVRLDPGSRHEALVNGLRCAS